MQGTRFDNKVNKVSAKSLSCSSENALNCERVILHFNLIFFTQNQFTLLQCACLDLILFFFTFTELFFTQKFFTLLQLNLT